MTFTIGPAGCELWQVSLPGIRHWRIITYAYGYRNTRVFAARPRMRRFRRFGRPGEGKRGGYRVITFFSGTDIPVFLLSVFAKNEKSDLSKDEKNELKKMLQVLPATYRRRAKK